MIVQKPLIGRSEVRNRYFCTGPRLVSDKDRFAVKGPFGADPESVIGSHLFFIKGFVKPFESFFVSSFPRSGRFMRILRYPASGDEDR